LLFGRTGTMNKSDIAWIALVLVIILLVLGYTIEIREIDILGIKLGVKPPSTGVPSQLRYLPPLSSQWSKL
jgi:hypothetical protein